MAKGHAQQSGPKTSANVEELHILRVGFPYSTIGCLGY